MNVLKTKQPKKSPHERGGSLDDIDIEPNQPQVRSNGSFLGDNSTIQETVNLDDLVGTENFQIISQFCYPCKNNNYSYPCVME